MVQVTTAARLKQSHLVLQSFDQHVRPSWEEDGDTVGGVHQEAGKRTRGLRVRLENPSDQGVGTARIRIATDDGAYVATLPVAWRLGPEVEVAPSAIYHSGIKVGTYVESRVVLRAKTGKPVAVRRVDLDGRSVDFHATRTESGVNSGQIVTVGIVAGRTPGVERHRAHIFLGERNTDVVELPITLSVR